MQVRFSIFAVSAGIVALTSAAVAAESVHYVCSDKTELTATFHTSPGEAHLVFSGGEVTLNLPQVVSADGGRYAKGDVEFWIKGGDATLSRGQRKTTCKS
jgi:membrane-bound inhibitor of C-type lysozyme